MQDRRLDRHTMSGTCLRHAVAGQGERVDELQLSSQLRGDVQVITVAGDLDIVSSRRLDACLTTGRRERKHIVLDLSGVEFMDTSTLATIVGHWKKMTGRGGSLSLTGARYRYTKTLWITGLADRLPLYDTVDQALAALGEEREAAELKGRPDGGQPSSAPGGDGPEASPATG
jgi:anti-anti-sigma factor